MGERDYWTAPELSRELGIHTITLQRWRTAGTGPEHYRIGNRIRYKKSVVSAWLKQQESK